MLLSEVADEGLRGAGAAWLGAEDAVVECLGGESFSGATVVRLRRRASEGDVVIKSFPAAARPRVAWVHALMAHVRATGCHEIPEVVPGETGETVVADRQGRVWEAVRFVAGTATAEPSLTQAQAAATTVARLHLAAASWRAATPRVSVPAAVARRVEQAHRLLAEPWHSSLASDEAGSEVAAAIAARVTQAVAIARDGGLDRALRSVATTRAAARPVQAVARDLWWSHVLYAADDPGRVAGVIDLHAAAIDTPATDLARLLGSWRSTGGLAADAWATALDAYESLRPLGADRQFVPWLDATATVFGLDNWFRWILVEGRRFERSARVVERVDRLLERLPPAVAWLRGHPASV